MNKNNQKSYPLPPGTYNQPLDPVGTILPKCPKCGRVVLALYRSRITGDTTVWCNHGGKARADRYIARKIDDRHKD